MAEITPATQARAVARACRTAMLATLMADGSGRPYASLALVAFDLDASPLLLISRLADHTKNLTADPRVSLLCDGTAGFAEPLTGPRVTLLGRVERTEAPQHRERFLRRHPGAAMYAGFQDFGFYRIPVNRAHIVAGFGRIHWFNDYAFEEDTAALAAAEGDILAHMNDEHTDAVQLYATHLLGKPHGGWRMCGVDPEGADLIRGTDETSYELARLPFEQPVLDAEAARTELVRLVKRARTAE